MFNLESISNTFNTSYHIKCCMFRDIFRDRPEGPEGAGSEQTDTHWTREVCLLFLAGQGIECDGEGGICSHDRGVGRGEGASGGSTQH